MGRIGKWSFMAVLAAVIFFSGFGVARAQDSVPQEVLDKLDKQHSMFAVMIKKFINLDYGEYKVADKQDELDACQEGLKKLYAQGKAPLVELADLWAMQWPQKHLLLSHHKTENGWELGIDKDILIKYGPDCGITDDPTKVNIVDFVQDHPEAEAMMAAERLQELFVQFGRRSPYAYQGFEEDLKPFLNGVVGQEAWGARPRLSMEEDNPKKTDFAGKYVVLGLKGLIFGGGEFATYEINRPGLLYWLWLCEDTDGIKNCLIVWRDQVKFKWDDATNVPVKTADPGQFEIKKEDIQYPSNEAAYLDAVKKIIDELGQAPVIPANGVTPAPATLPQ